MPQETHNLTAFHRLLALTSQVNSKFADKAQAAAWLQTPNADLGGASPLSLLNTREGAERVAASLQKA